MKIKGRVYIATISDMIKNTAESEKIYPQQRAAEISAARNDDVRRQKTAVWQLLSEALSHSFGLDASRAELFKDENGKWNSALDGVFFSLSHTDTLCAVCTSSVLCGTDIEKFRFDGFGKAFSKRILCPDEYESYLSMSENDAKKYAAMMWTQKESIFKMTGGKTFVPANIKTCDFSVQTIRVSYEGEEFFVSASSSENDEWLFLPQSDKIEILQ